MNTKRKFKYDDRVKIKGDIRGFVATYRIVGFNGNKALLEKTHFWKTDPIDGSYQRTQRLELLNP